MSKSFADQLAEDIAAKKSTDTERANTEREAAKLREEERRARTAKTLGLLGPVLEETKKGLEAHKYAVGIRLKNTRVDGLDEDTGYEVSISRPSGVPSHVVFDAHQDSIAIKGEHGNTESSGNKLGPIATPEDAQRLVRKVLSELKIL